MIKNCPNKSITKPVSKTISDQDMVYWWSDDKCNVFCWLALKENWGKILVAVGNSKKMYRLLTFPTYAKKLRALTI